MPEASREIEIRRPVEAVFGFLADAENDALWRSGVLEIKRIAGDGVGTTYRQVVKGPGGRRVSADVEITDFAPNELIGFKATSGPVRPRGRFRFVPVDDGTRVRFELHADVTGLKRLMASMVQKTMDREMEALDKLKRVLEGGERRDQPLA